MKIIYLVTEGVYSWVSYIVSATCPSFFRFQNQKCPCEFWSEFKLVIVGAQSAHVVEYEAIVTRWSYHSFTSILQTFPILNELKDTVGIEWVLLVQVFLIGASWKEIEKY